MSKGVTKVKKDLPINAFVELVDEMEGDDDFRKKFDKLYSSYVIECMNNIANNQYNIVKKNVMDSEIISILIREKVKSFSEEDRRKYAMGLFEGAYDTINTWYKMRSYSMDFEYNIRKILSKKHMREIVDCIKNNPGIQNKIILQNVNIKANYLNELTNELVYYHIINRFIIGKNTFYELTQIAKEYFKKKERREIRDKYGADRINMYISNGDCCKIRNNVIKAKINIKEQKIDSIDINKKKYDVAQYMLERKGYNV